MPDEPDVLEQQNISDIEPEAEGPQPEAEPIPAWAQALVEQNKTLQESLRVTQGQARRAEQQALAAYGRGQAPPVSPDEPDPTEKLLDRLDDSDEGARVIKQAFKSVLAEKRHLSQSVASLTAQRERERLDSEMRAWRQHNYDQLAAFAEVADVDIRPLGEAIVKLSNDDLWEEGKRMIREAKGKKAPPAPAAEPNPLVYSERRRSSGLAPRNYEAMRQGYIDGDVSGEEWETYMKAHPRPT